MSRSPHVLLFDLYAGGHHGQYVRHLVTYWDAHRLPGRLSVAAPPRFFEIHDDVRRQVEATGGVEASPVTEPADLRGDGFRALLRADRTHGRLLRHTITALRPTHTVLLYLDHAQLSLAVDLRFPFPVQLSGIYFRPSFHYDRLGSPAPGIGARLDRLRKRLTLAAALRNPHLTHLFCLDPYVLPDVGRMSRRVQAVALPDGVAALPPHAPPEELRDRWNVESGRRVALFFGSVSARKGIHQTLEAVTLLPPEHRRRLCLAVVGAVQDTDAARVHDAVRRLQADPSVQVVLDDRFVGEEEIQGLIEAADLVLLPYQRHLGSSGVLVRAALAGRPVLGSDYGLLGEHLRARRLGAAVDSTSPRMLAEGLRQWLDHPDTFPFDASEARRFADEHTAEQFAAILFRHLTG